MKIEFTISVEGVLLHAYQWARRRRGLVTGAGLGLLLVATLAATSPTHTFTSGTVIQAAQVNTNFTELHALVSESMPPGTVVAFAGATPPAGWALCDGQTLSRTTYPELYAAIGDAHGAPNGSSFNVPDLRGRFVRGVAGSTSNDPDKDTRARALEGADISANGNKGNAVGSRQLGAMASHTHGYQQAYSQGLSVAGGGFVAFNANTGATSAATGGSENRPVNIYLNYIIKLDY
ncbi:MAG: tail fiber protein [Pseudomonadota bacterium]